MLVAYVGQLRFPCSKYGHHLLSLTHLRVSIPGHWWPPRSFNTYSYSARLILDRLMLPPSPTNDPLAPHRYGLHGHAHSKHPSDAKYLGNLRAVPLAAVTRTTSQLSSQSVASYSSTTELVPHPDSKREKRKSLRDRVVSWSWRSEKTPDSEMTRFGEPEESVPGNTKRKRIKAWQGWRFILFGSCNINHLNTFDHALTPARFPGFNVFLLLIPISVSICASEQIQELHNFCAYSGS